MKKSSLLIASLAITVLGFSQEKKVRFGIQGGANIANVNSKFTYSSFGTSYTNKQSLSAITGFTAGVHAEIYLGNNFYLQPELSYSQLGSKNVLSNSDSTSPGKFEAKSTLHYMVLPILVKYKLPKIGASIFVGPQYGYLLGVTNKINTTTINEKDNSNYKSDISGVFGAEYYFPMGLGVSARYQLGITNIQKPEYINVGNLPMGTVANSISVRNSAVAFTIGYRF